MLKARSRTLFKAGLLLVLLTASGCVTNSGDLTQTSGIKVDIQQSTLGQIHKVAVVEDGDGVLVRGHVSPHGNIQPSQKLTGTVHIEANDANGGSLGSWEVSFPIRHHRNSTDFPEFFLRIPKKLPVGSVVHLQYHKNMH